MTPASASLLDRHVRAAVTDRLGGLWAGRPVILGPSVLAAWTPYVAWFRDLGCPVLVLATARGAGAVPAEDTCKVVRVEPPAAALLTEELRTLDRLTRRLPMHVIAAVEAFDPGRRGTWYTSPFVTTDLPILGRPVTGGRPATYLALEDKMLADQVWEAADVPHAPYRHVALEDDLGLGDAVSALGHPTLGAVLVGDNRDGFHGHGDYVRWVRDADDLVRASAFFKPRCDRVRVTAFLDGVPCSIHGVVLPDGTAALRPVEIATLRNPVSRSLVYGGLGTTWDPPERDRDQMRAATRRVGAYLQRTHGYRGAFGIDGVLTADGFLPTELNTRMSAGATTAAEVDRRFFTFLQAALVAGVETGVTAYDVEELVTLMDEHRTGKVVAVAEGAWVDVDDSFPVTWDGRIFARAAESDGETGSVFSIGETPTGCFAKIDPCAQLVPGQRLAQVNVGLLAFMDSEYGSTFGALEPAPEVRT